MSGRTMELDHLILNVNEREPSLAFYRDVVGFPYEGEPFSVVRVHAGLTLQLAPWGTPGGLHLAFAMPRAELDRAFDRIQKAGIPCGDSFHNVGNNRGPGSETGARGAGPTVSFFDPNKHLIEIRHYEG